MEDITCIIFDFGGVIGLPHDQDRVKTMAKMVDMPVNAFEKAYFYHRTAYDQGLIDRYDYWKRITGQQLDKSLVDQLVVEDYLSWARINQEVVAFIQSLKGEVDQIVLLSNINVDAKAYIQDELHLFDLFTKTYCSCDLKLMKPHRAIYDYVLESLQVRPQACLFIDDTEANVIGAREALLNSVVFEDLEQLKKMLRR